MNRTIVVAAVASVSLILAMEPAPAGSGIGKGSPSTITSAPGTADITASGTIAAVYPGSMSFSCNCGSGTYSFPTTASTVIRKGDSPASFSDLTPGAAVQIAYHFAGDGIVTDQVVIAP